MTDGMLNYLTPGQGRSRTARYRAASALRALGVGYAFVGFVVGMVLFGGMVFAIDKAGLSAIAFPEVVAMLSAGSVPIAIGIACFLYARRMIVSSRPPLVPLCGVSLGLGLLLVTTASLMALGGLPGVACFLVLLLLIAVLVHGMALMSLIGVLRAEKGLQ